MEQLFSRDGVALVATRTEKNRPYHRCPAPCTRCGGAGGSDKWKHTGWTCYECNGAKTLGYQNIRLYTQTELDKLNTRREALRAKRQDEAKALRASVFNAFKEEWAKVMESARPYAENEFLRKMLEIYDAGEALSLAQVEAVQKSIERQIEWAKKDAARKALREGSNWLAGEGTRVDVEGVIENVVSFPCTLWNGDKGDFFITTIRSIAGDCVVVKGSAIYNKVKFDIFTKGEQIKLRGTVKELSEYKGQKQTQLQRVAVQYA